MLFASIELAARIENAEARLLSDIVPSSKKRRSLPDAFCHDIGGGVAGYNEPGSPFNKTIGLGFDGSVSVEDLSKIERAYKAVGSPVQIELSTLADPSVGELLSNRGYVLKGFENVQGCDLSRPLNNMDEPVNVNVEPSDMCDFSRWMQIIVNGFMSLDQQGIASRESYSTDLLERVIGDIAIDKAQIRLLALHEGQPAGAASMRVSGDIAQFCGAATLVVHRGNGVQSALIRRRLKMAQESGCSIAVVTTQPGSKSMENMQRHGFDLLYSRAVFVLEPAASG